MNTLIDITTSSLEQLADVCPEPKTKIGLKAFLAIAKTLASGGDSDDVREGLKVLEQHGGTIIAYLKERHDQAAASIDPGKISQDFIDLAEHLYRRNLADEFLYADFKGIEQQSQFVTLELDEVFVNLKCRSSERTEQSKEKPTVVISAHEHSPLFESLGDEIPREDSQDKSDGRLQNQRRQAPLSIDQWLARPDGIVLLGGPGSGKTTLIKRLARTAALGTEPMREHFPAIPNSAFPIVVSLTSFSEWRNSDRTEQTLEDFIEHLLRDLGGEPLVQAFNQQWGFDHCLILLDGLDEIATADRRIATARAVDHLYHRLGGNRAVVTSRIVGYSGCRLSVPAEHVELEPFDREDVEAFCRQWHRAYELSIHPEAPRLDKAEQQAKGLIDEISSNDAVADLAKNPLMLTIIALIRHKQLRLPEKRVELYKIALSTLIDSWNRARSLSGIPLGEASTDDTFTFKLWAHVAYWMHEKTSRGTLRQESLHEKLVEVLTEEFEVPVQQAEVMAESYLETAARTSGLLEERGVEQFAFMHQTFQEFLAGHRLAVPTRKAIERILPHVGDPRWHEPIRLAAGMIGIHQQDDETLADLIDALLQHDEDDPLGPYLCTGVRLAAACISDQVGFKPRHMNRVVIALCNRLQATTFSPLVEALSESLRTINVDPDTTAVSSLIELSHHEHWMARMEAARKLARVVERDGEAQQCLYQLSFDVDIDVKAHAASGLVRISPPNRDRLHSWMRGWTSPYSKFPQVPPPDLIQTVVELLKYDANDRRLVAETLGAWGHQEQTFPTLLKLLEDDDTIVRWQAAQTLGAWGHQEQALPALLQLLEDDNANVRQLAAQTLGAWGHQEQALPALLQLLEDDDANVRQQTAWTLGAWGHQEQTLPAFLQLLEDGYAYMRWKAAQTLGAWGHQEQALPALLQLLEDDDANVRRLAAQTLGAWGHQEQALPALLKLLEDDDAYDRRLAAQTLGAWGYQEQTLPAFLQLLKDDDADVRRQAAQTLGAWGPHRQITTALGICGEKATMKWLDLSLADPTEPVLSHGNERCCPPEAACELAEHLGLPPDSETDAMRKRVLHQWVWNAANGS